MGFHSASTVTQSVGDWLETEGEQLEKEGSTTTTTILPNDSPLYQPLECGPDGQPGGILITSVAQEIIPNVWLGGYKALEDLRFLRKNKITYILTLGHFKYQYPAAEFMHKVCWNSRYNVHRIDWPQDSFL